MRVEGIGKEGQAKLAASSVLIVGAGALGSPLAMYLGGAGVGKIIIADFDTVELTNLHRQIFYTERDAGKSKSRLLESRIKNLNSDIEVVCLESLVTKRFLEDLPVSFSMIADCADNPSTTYLLDNYCFAHSIPLSTAGVSGWSAQVFTYIPGSVRYSDLFLPPDDAGAILPCSITGITGPTAAFASSLQATQIMKTLLGMAEKSSLLAADLLSLNVQVASI